MRSSDAWKPFQEVALSPWPYVRAWKQQTGEKIVGHLLPDVPEEIVHAAGAVPVAIEGAGVQVSLSQSHLPAYSCSHAMGALELGLNGELEGFDGMVIPYVCDTTRNLFHIWNHLFPQMANEFLRLPKRIDYPEAKEYLRQEFIRFFDSMKKLTGKDATENDLNASISLYNKSRLELRRAYKVRREHPSVWTSERVQAVFASALRMPREEHLLRMEALPWDEPVEDSGSRIAVYVRGKVWDPPEILDMLDRLSFLVVEDEMVSGYRSVVQDAEDSDPFMALVNRHFATTPYTGYHQDPERMAQGFLDRVRSSGAQGVIFLNPKFCEASGFDTPDFQKALEEAGVPSLILETSSRGVSLGQIQVRLEAFGEVLAGDLP